MKSWPGATDVKGVHRTHAAAVATWVERPPARGFVAASGTAGLSAVTPPATRLVMALLRAHVPIALLADLASGYDVDSAEILRREGGSARPVRRAHPAVPHPRGG